MQILNKGSRVYEMIVKASKEEFKEIEETILKSNGVIMGRKQHKEFVSYLIVVDLVEMDELIDAMLVEYPEKIRFRKAKEIIFK